MVRIEWADKSEDSYLYKHAVQYHNGETFGVDVKILAQCFGKPTTRMITEAVKIEELPEENLLNSKSEWTYVRLPRVGVVWFVWVRARPDKWMRVVAYSLSVVVCLSVVRLVGSPTPWVLHETCIQISGRGWINIVWSVRVISLNIISIIITQDVSLFISYLLEYNIRVY